ncbi:ATP-grasp domain-containing protein [Methylophaga sp. OBS3]|uniref:ATP-grasp domain-containing protein n=1 Tax=Methylophaga sp. OBS3 TaxID=2991934 RepID=UPI002252B40B|nr:ATP-grasp domain-containing protein [Methylophaga sp. OBS3]MCX4189521.1 ATP-grasp domain-containing protein [Methylophaga sp. OBS3]
MAHRSDYRVCVADHFGDVDTLAITEQYRTLPSFEKIDKASFQYVVSALTGNQPAILVIGTGIERLYPYLQYLPDNIQLANNSYNTLIQCLPPKNWFRQLHQHQILFPQTYFTQPEQTSGLIQKSAFNWGGSHITLPSKASQTEPYYQEFIEGQPASVLFIANGHEIKLLSFNRQFCRNAEEQDYRLQAVISSTLEPTIYAELHGICQQLTQSMTLKGFQSLDFVIDNEGKLWVLELNPRPSASMQCLPSSWPLIDWHINACQGKLPAILDNKIPAKVWYGVFADIDIIIPEEFIWPDYVFDIPPAGSLISKGDIICSLVLDCGTNDGLSYGHTLATQLQYKLENNAV